MSSTPSGSDAPESEPAQPWTAPPPVPKPGVIPLRPLSFTDIMGGAFATFQRYPKLLLGAALVVIGVPNVLAFVASWWMVSNVDQSLFHTGLTDTQAAEAFRSLFWISVIGAVLAVAVLVVSQVVLAGFTTIVVSRAVLGKPVAAGEVWQRLRARMLPLDGVTILYGICLVTGLVLCILPGIWIGVRKAFQRSKALLRDAWWQTFGVLVVTAIMTWVASAIVQLPVSIVGLNDSIAFLRTGRQELSFGTSLLATAARIVADTVAYPFSAAVIVLLYIDRRIVRERLGLQLIEASA
jgi:hypothetical protein